MSTEVNSFPPLAGWVRAAQLIATAKVVGIEELPRTDANDHRRKALARVALGKVIKGNPTSREISLRFVDGDFHPYREKGELLLLAVLDVGPGSSKETYVAYLGAALPYDGKQVALPVGRDASGRLVTERITVDGLVEAVHHFEAVEAERSGLAKELESADRFDFALPTTEMPTLDVPGPIQATFRREGK